MAELPSSSAAAARGGFMAAIFLMATSAIGPGFITQSATFTAKLGAAFAFAILASILIDFVVQLNIWRITALTRRNASDTANAAIPGAGYLLAILVLVGGLAFNIGNIAGAGLGLNAIFGLDPKIGGAISALLAVGIFLSRRAGLLLDRSLIGLGLLMIGMTLVVAFASNPPVGDALRQTFLPDVIDFPTITTIVGGTVGVYITYSGAHRLLDKGLVGKENLAAVTRAALTGIAVTGVMRAVLFLAILGVVASGVTLDLSGQVANPAVQAFAWVLGDVGFRVFGVIFWAAAITSVIGAAYTSVSFLVVFSERMDERARNIATVIYLHLAGGLPADGHGASGAAGLRDCLKSRTGRSAGSFWPPVRRKLGPMRGIAPAFSPAGRPKIPRRPSAADFPNSLFVGGFNGLILPIGLSIFTYVGFARPDLMDGHVYNRPLLIACAIVCILTWYMGYNSIGPIFAFLSA